MNCLLADASLIPTTLGQIASLWAIRIAMLLLVVVFTLQLLGMSKTNKGIAGLWLLGALLSLGHSVGALFTFHHANLAEAYESTARQTHELMGFRVGAGLYVNYVFVFVWLTDAVLRLTIPNKYNQFPKSYFIAVYGFLLFIAVNGAIIFKSGWIRIFGCACAGILLLLCWCQRARDHTVRLGNRK